MFFLKLTVEEAQTMISAGISDLFGATPIKFEKYTYYIEDPQTFDKYWLVDNVQYKGIKYDVIGFLNENFPDITRYTLDFVNDFLPIAKP